MGDFDVDYWVERAVSEWKTTYNSHVARVWIKRLLEEFVTSIRERASADAGHCSTCYNNLQGQVNGLNQELTTLRQVEASQYAMNSELQRVRGLMILYRNEWMTSEMRCYALAQQLQQTQQSNTDALTQQLQQTQQSNTNALARRLQQTQQSNTNALAQQLQQTQQNNSNTSAAQQLQQTQQNNSNTSAHQLQQTQQSDTNSLAQQLQQTQRSNSKKRRHSHAP